jgi:hypothetical protein
MLVTTFLLLASCGGDKPPPKSAEEAPDESWNPDGDAEKKAKPEAEAPAEGPSGPELKLRDASMIEASVDYTGAVLIIGESAKLTFPEEALAKGLAVHFGLAQSKQSGPGRLGSVYEFAPGATSSGPPFVLELPLPRGKKQANFALFRYEGEKVVWDVRAATRIDEENGVAILEIEEIGEGWIHLTTANPE